MSISATNLTSGSDNSGSITGETTASVTLDAGALALLVVRQRVFGSAPSTPVASGWTQVTTVSFTGNLGFFSDVITVLRRLSGSPTTGTVTFTCGLSSEVDWSIDQFTGVNPSGTNGSNAIAQAGTASDSSDSQTSFSFNLTNPVNAGNASYGAFSTDQVVNLSVGSGYSLLVATNNLITEWESPASQTIAASSDANTSWGGIGLEIVAATEALPFWRNRIANTVISAWQPTWPYLFGGQQPYTGRKLSPSISSAVVDNPPVGLSVRRATLNETVWQWRPADWPPVYLGGREPYQRRNLSPSIADAIIDAPVFRGRRSPQLQAIIVAAAQPNPWSYVPLGGRQPYGGRTLPPSILLQFATLPLQGNDIFTIFQNNDEDPPFGILLSPQQKAIIVAAAQPDPWVYAPSIGRQPYGRRQLPPGINSATIDNPPIGLPVRRERLNETVWQWRAADWPVVFAGARQPYMGRQLPPSLANATIDNPPVGLPVRQATLNATVWQWRATDWPSVFAGARQPYAYRLLTPSDTPVNNPPFGIPNPATRSVILAQWQPPWQASPWVYTFLGGRQPYQPRTLTPNLINAVVNNPPFRNPGRLAQTVTEIWHWQPTLWPVVFMGAQGPYKQRQLPPSILSLIRQPNRVVSNVLVRCRVVRGRRSDAG